MNDVGSKQAHGAAYKTRVRRKKTKFSRTRGKDKGIRPSPLDRTMAKRSRSYKHQDYQAWRKRYSGGKVRGKG